MNPEVMLQRLEWQAVLFAPRPQRLALLKLSPSWPCQEVRIRVHRNHAFEPVATVAQPYLAYGGWRGEFTLSDYDDSLNFNLAGAAGVEIVWLDFERFQSRLNPAELAAWLAGRLRQLRQATTVPILVANSPSAASAELNTALAQLAASLPGVKIAPLEALSAQLGGRFFDQRTAALSGTRFSNEACLVLARELACHWLPALLRPRIKAVAVDLDHTLYSGVLGEDGLEGVRLTAGHLKLQTQLLGLRQQGLFLALVSRNEPEDVRLLLSRRADFALRWEHFSATAISWQEKAAGLRQVAGQLRIGLDAILFLDDNPGELAAVNQALPQVHILHAHPDPLVTAASLEFYPGLWSWGTTETDALRAADLQSATERAAVETRANDPREYWRDLRVKLAFAVKSRAELARLHELSQKTNQFNLNLSRFSEPEMARYLEQPDRGVASIRLSDRLSDSGLIGMVCGRKEQDCLLIEELCVSCRALGRHLENLMIGESVRLLREQLGCATVAFAHRTGPRNQPARQWLATLSGAELVEPEGIVPAPSDFGQKEERDLPVELQYSAGE